MRGNRPVVCSGLRTGLGFGFNGSGLIALRRGISVKVGLRLILKARSVEKVR